MWSRELSAGETILAILLLPLLLGMLPVLLVLVVAGILDIEFTKFSSKGD